MSGGYFDYKQYQIGEIIEKIEERIEINGKINGEERPGEEQIYPSRVYSDKTIKRFKDALHVLKRAKVFAQRIDWLLSGDDGEENFHKRLKEDLKEAL